MSTNWHFWRLLKMQTNSCIFLNKHHKNFLLGYFFIPYVYLNFDRKKNLEVPEMSRSLRHLQLSDDRYAEFNLQIRPSHSLPMLSSICIILQYSVQLQPWFVKKVFLLKVKTAIVERYLQCKISFSNSKQNEDISYFGIIWDYLH